MKLGFIALSGLRSYNKELKKLGLTLPGLIDRNGTIASLPSLGLLTLAGMTPDDVEVEYVEVNDVGTICDIPGEYDMVAISSLSAQIKDAYRLADRYCEKGTYVVLGGLHVSAMPVEASKHADSIVVGEGELVWSELISDLRYNKLKTIYNTRGQSFDLAEAPMPRFELLKPERYNRLTVQTQRGCPFNCEFCASSRSISPAYKVKPIEKVINEIRYIKEIWPHPFIEFADDNTFVNKGHAKRLLRSLSRENIRWFTETDISVAYDDELLEMIRDSGCAQLLIGFESPSPSGLNGLEKKTNWKAKQLDRYKYAIDKIQSYGITVNGCFVLGLDGTGLESFDNIWQFVQESGLYEVQVTVLTPFPGTPLYERLKNSGRLLHKNAWELCTLFDVNFKPQNMSVTELELNFRCLVERLYCKEFTHERRQKYLKRLRKAKRFERQQLKEKGTSKIKTDLRETEMVAEAI